MYKIFFPAGLEILTTDSHKEFQSTFDLFKDKPHLSDSDKTSILLLSRTFSLLSIDSHSSGAQLNFEPLDYDLSQFCTYVRSLKFLMKSNFQTIMYRMYRLGRAEIRLY